MRTHSIFKAIICVWVEYDHGLVYFSLGEVNEKQNIYIYIYTEIGSVEIVFKKLRVANTANKINKLDVHIGDYL